tara:strand:- start:113 stop:1483 length:1371 start_codon:yes stop_codon:yes gene_type:complete
MSAIKEGSVMEGIFAMYCAAYLIDPESGKSQSSIEKFINDLRVDTTLGDLIGKGLKSVDYNNTFPGKLGTAKKRFGKGVTVVTGKDAQGMIKDSPKFKTLKTILKNSEKFFESLGIKGYLDFSQVELKVRVKEAETGLYYGPNLKKLIDAESTKGSVGDKKYKSIKEKMIFLIRNRESQFFKDLKSTKERYLKNSKNDVVHWTVDADGIGGETSGGTIKQDVTIRIFADGKRIMSRELNFSLKSDSVSVHGGGIYNSLPEIYDMFKGVIPNNFIEEGKKYMKEVEGQGTTVSRKESVDALWKLIGTNLPNTPNTQWSDHFWDILEKRLFGTGYKGKMQLLEMNKTELREISKSNFERLRNSGVQLYPSWYKAAPTADSPGDIRIMPLYKGGKKETNDSNYVFKIRIAYRKTGPKDGAGKRHGKAYPNKVYIELGGKKSIVHDENYDVYLEKGLVDQ